MRIAIPVQESSNTLAGEFSPSPLFALYDVHDETRAVAYLGRKSVDQPGCAHTPGFLQREGVEVVLAHDISTSAINHLLEVGILAIKDAPILPPDALLAHLVSGTLQATPPDAAIHGAGQGGCGGGDSGGCGHCCGGHAHGHDHADHAHDTPGGCGAPAADPA